MSTEKATESNIEMSSQPATFHPFLRLPLELRNRIYEEILGRNVMCFQEGLEEPEMDLDPDTGHLGVTNFSTTAITRGVPTALLQASCQAHDEAAKVLYRNPFFADLVYLESLLETMGQNIHLIRHLVTEVYPHTLYRDHGGLCVMTGLQSVTILFRLDVLAEDDADILPQLSSMFRRAPLSGVPLSLHTPASRLYASSLASNILTWWGGHAELKVVLVGARTPENLKWELDADWPGSQPTFQKPNGSFKTAYARMSFHLKRVCVDLMTDHGRATLAQNEAAASWAFTDGDFEVAEELWDDALERLFAGE